MFNAVFLRDDYINSFDRVLDGMFNEMFVGKNINVSKGTYPKCNVMDTDKAILLNAAVPGMELKDINVEVKEGILTLSGGTGSNSENYLMREIKMSKFKRSFELGDNLDSDAIEATFENGILELVIPKKEPEKIEAKKIEIKGAK